MIEWMDNHSIPFTIVHAGSKPEPTSTSMTVAFASRTGIRLSRDWNFFRSKGSCRNDV